MSTPQLSDSRETTFVDSIFQCEREVVCSWDRGSSGLVARTKALTSQPQDAARTLKLSAEARVSQHSLAARSSAW
jgi:hypothetical protein